MAEALPDGPELIAGEMRLWSDLAEGVPRPAAGGPVLTSVVRAVLDGVSGRVLVAGPHDPALLDAVVDCTSLRGAELVVVVRALPDAELVAQRQPHVKVVCGGLDAFDSDPFDVVIALDGAERLLSNDSPWQSWAQRVESLAARITPTGRLLLEVDNPLSIAALADARRPAERRDTGDWEAPPWTDRSRVAGMAALRDRLHDLGLTGPAYALLAHATRPTALLGLSGSLGAEVAVDPRVRHAVRAGTRLSMAGRELLFDPSGETLAALAGERLDLAAAGWLTVLGRQDAVVALPEAWWLDQPGRPGAAVLAVSADGTTTVAEQVAHVDHEGPVRRTGEPVLAAPAGQPLDLVLSDLALAEDLPGLRTIVGLWLAWVDELARKEPSAAALATPENVLVDAGSLALLDDSWRVESPVDAATATARVALCGADLLLDPSMRTIWPPWMSTAALARSLLAMARLSETAPVWGAAEELHERLRVVEAPAVLDGDLRSVKAVNEELQRVIWALRGQLHAHDRLATNRDRQLERRSARVQEAERRATVSELEAALSRQEAAALRGSLSFRLGRALRHPSLGARALYRRLRRS